MGATRLLLFCLLLSGAFSLRKLTTIDDLKNITYAKSAPRHGLQLLFWFAQNVLNVDQRNNLILDSDFNPCRGDFGFHQYRDTESILPSLRSWQSYYVVGNLKSPGASALPAYVQRYHRNTNVPERNMDRLIVSVMQNKPNRIHSVFITAHDLHNGVFSTSDTYEVDPALILQIGVPDNCTVDKKNDDSVYKIPRTEKTDKCLEFLKEIGYSTADCKHSHVSHRKKRSPYFQCATFEKIYLDIKTSTQGYSKVVWEMPNTITENSNYVYIDICQNTYSRDTNEVQTQVLEQIKIYEASGSLDTTVSLNSGLQPRLRLYPSLFDYQYANAHIWLGPEFDGANRELPTGIQGYGASLHLYSEDGKACARLYIKKTFSDWMNAFTKSWVGFYKSSGDETNDYSTYQYAKKFEKIENSITHNYDIYQYTSSLAIAPGVQIRFMLDKSYNKILAQTTPWEGEETLTIMPLDCGTLNPRLLPEYGRELFYGPGFDDAGLQLFAKDGKACARVYFKRIFTDWKEVFYYSWVGFYRSSQDKNDEYSDYHYITKFEKVETDNENYYIYEYKSKMDIASGVQVRFLMDKSYDRALAQTKPWNNGL